MAEPATPSIVVGSGLAVAIVAALGPTVAEYAPIVFWAGLGSLWPLAQHPEISRAQGWLLVLRLVVIAAALTGLVAWGIEHYLAFPAAKTTAPIACFIAALGDRWGGLLNALASRLGALISTAKGPEAKP